MSKIKDWNKRPKGCHRTISGRHIPKERFINYGIEFYCSACGLIDDTNTFSKWLGYGRHKVDDTQEIK